MSPGISENWRQERVPEDFAVPSGSFLPCGSDEPPGATILIVDEKERVREHRTSDTRERYTMPTISARPERGQYNEDLTLLTLYSLAGEESGGVPALRPDLFKKIGKYIFAEGAGIVPGQITEAVDVRELTPAEMVRAEKELWIHYHQQKADRRNDRLFAVFTGTRIIGVARCSRHEDGLEVDAVYVLEEYRLKGFARSVMILLIEECGRNETLYMHSKSELVNFYGSLGFRPIPEIELPKSIRDRFGFCMGDLDSIKVCPMRREPDSAEKRAGKTAATVSG